MYDKVLKKPRDSPEFQNYKQYHNMYNKLQRKAKFQYYNELIQENKHNSKKLWAILNTLTGIVVNKKDTDEILVNGMKENNKQLISNAFAKQYSEVGKILANKIEEKGNIKNPMNCMKNKVEHNCFYFQPQQLKLRKLLRV